MTITVELSVGTDDVPFGKVFDVVPDAEIDVEPLVRPNGRSSLRVRGIDPDLITDTLVEDAHIDSVCVLDAFDESTLLDVEWESNTAGSAFFRVLAANDATVLQQTGTNRGWQFTLRFPDSAATQVFQGACHEAGLSIDIQRVSQTTESDGVATRLTDAQCDVFEMALERGYFAVPRRTTLVELGEELGISDQAVSERLRRAQTKIGEAAMRRDGPSGF